MQYMHADQVTEPPDGATLLGEAPHCPVAMFQCGARLLGIEAHPEFPAAYARALIEDRRARIGEEVAEEALARADERTDCGVGGGGSDRVFGVSPRGGAGLAASSGPGCAWFVFSRDRR